MLKLKLYAIAAILLSGVIAYGAWLQYRVSTLKTKLNTVHAELAIQQSNYERLDRSIKTLTTETANIQRRLTQQKAEIAKQPDQPLSAAVKKALELISGGNRETTTGS